MPTSHGTITGENHVPYNWTYADAAARTAATGMVPDDVGKLARQLDTNALYMLTDDSPVTWTAVGGGGSGTITVQEGDSDVDTAVTTVDFDSSDFNVTSSPAGEANVALNYGTGAGQPAEGNHDHNATYQPLDATLTDLAALADPNDDRIVFWDDSAGGHAYLDIGANLSISGTTLDASGVGGSAEQAYLTTNYRLAHVMKIPGATTTTNGIGFSNAILTGTNNAAADDADGAWVALRTSTTDNNAAQANDTGSVFTQFRQDWLSEITFLVKTDSDVSSIAFHVGATSTAPARAAAEHAAYFTYDTDIDGTAFWRAFSANNSGSSDLTALSVAIAADTVYRLRIKLLNTDVEFYINDVLEATHTTRVPAATQSLGWVARILTRTTAIRGLKFSRMSCKQKG